jgi:hypothetical protein
MASLAVLSAAGCGSQDDEPSISDRLQGNWVCDRVIREGEFDRTDKASLEILDASIRYAYESHWECAVSDTVPDGSGTPACATEPPRGRQGYFEGVFAMKGDSMEVEDASDTVSYRDLRADSLGFVVNGTIYPMKRN